MEGVVGEKELREGEVEGEVLEVGGGEGPGEGGGRVGVVGGDEGRGGGGGGGGGGGRDGGKGALELEEESVGFAPGGGHEGGRERAHVFEDQALRQPSLSQTPPHVLYWPECPPSTTTPPSLPPSLLQDIPCREAVG